MLWSNVSIAIKSNRLQINGIYESMTNVHGHEQYKVDPCDIYEVENMAIIEEKVRRTLLKHFQILPG
jgi:hypothetical protein